MKSFEAIFFFEININLLIESHTTSTIEVETKQIHIKMK